MLNHITVMGRLTRDPELRRTNTGLAVASFTLACDRDFADKQTGKRETDFIDCVAWRQTGEFVAKYFSKGRMAVASGRLQIRPWTDKDGNKRRTAEIVADNVYFGDSKQSQAVSDNNVGNTGSMGGGYYRPPDNSGSSYPSAGFTGGTYVAPIQVPESDFGLLEDDDAQLPF